MPEKTKRNLEYGSIEISTIRTNNSNKSEIVRWYRTGHFDIFAPVLSIPE